MRCCVEHLTMYLWAGRTAVSARSRGALASLGQSRAGKGDSYLEAVDDKAVASEHPLQHS